MFVGRKINAVWGLCVLTLPEEGDGGKGGE